MEVLEKKLEEIKGIDIKIKDLQALRKSLVKEIEGNGYIINNDKLVESQPGLAVTWDLDYNDYFVGEKGMYTIESSGSRKLSEEDFATIKKMITHKQYEDLADFLHHDVLNIKDSMLHESHMENATVILSGDDSIQFLWTEKAYEEGSMNIGSFIKVHMSTTAEIKNAPKKHKKVNPY